MSDLRREIFLRPETDGFHDVIARLEGRVFHVTKEENMLSIERAGAILPNESGVFKSAFGNYKNSFFRKRGCISLFDWRGAPSEENLDFRYRCWPLQGAIPGGLGVSIIILNSDIEEKLITWDDVKAEWAWDEMIVPCIEVGHRGPVSISFFEEVLIVRKEVDPNCFAAIVRGARS